MPKTRAGKLSLESLLVFVLAYIIFWLLVASGQRGGQTFFSNPLLAVIGIIMALSGISAFFTGLMGIIKQKERSILVFLATAIGFLVLIFVLGEILFPH
jgi:cytochrome bd-type quinol oxidase subunit 2